MSQTEFNESATAAQLVGTTNGLPGSFMAARNHFRIGGSIRAIHIESDVAAGTYSIEIKGGSGRVLFAGAMAATEVAFNDMDVRFGHGEYPTIVTVGMTNPKATLILE